MSENASDSRLKNLDTMPHVNPLDASFNLCPATPVYMRFQACFKPNNMSLKWII